MLLDILSGPLYGEARSAIIKYETLEGERATQSIIELRDALDHIWHAAIADTDDEAKANLETVAEHIRRAAVEPAQKTVENRLHKIRHQTQYYTLKRLLFSDLPEQSYIDDRLAEIVSRLRAGRDCKVDHALEAIKHFNEAHLTAKNLYDRIAQRSWKSPLRFLAWAAPIGIGVLGVVLTAIALL